MIRKGIIVFAFFIIAKLGLGQVNLVPNPSFEIISECPYRINKIFTPPWRTPNAGGPDSYNTCFIGKMGVPENLGGFQFAKTGQGYTGIILYMLLKDIINYYFEHRQYIQVQLTDSLVIGKNYKVGCYINLIDSGKYAIDNIGIYFSKDTFYFPSISKPPYVPQIEFDTLLTDTQNWMYLSKVYKAFGGEQCITIGNFQDSVDVNSFEVHNGGRQEYAYYNIDDVFVIPCDTFSSALLTICSSDSIYLQGAWRKQAGVYIDTLKTYIGCDSVVTTTLLIQDSHPISNEIKICEGDSVFYNGKFYKIPGTYNDTMISVNSCDNVYITKIVAETCEVVIPNVITPNMDGINDLFEVQHNPNHILELIVYNRWGNKIFESANYQNNWPIEDIPEGVYYYIINNTYDNKRYFGYIHVLW